jgi:ubiquinone/menaquinone biosynthesis C-methylase UbiE
MPDGWNERQRGYYEAHASGYERQRTGRERAYRRKALLLHATLPNRVGALLEVGVGTGLVTTHLASLVRPTRYVGLDLSLAMIELARARGGDRGVDFVVGDAVATGLRDARFDAVVAVDILHHVENPVQALHEWCRVTTPGGRLAVLETNGCHPVNLVNLVRRHEWGVFRNTKRNLAIWAWKAGWQNVEVRPTASFTPSGPPALAGVLDAMDRSALNIPGSSWLTGLWLITAQKRLP